MKRNIILLMGLFPPQDYETIRRNSKGNVQYAADALQKSILKGLTEWEETVTVVNLPFVGSYPARYRKPYIRSYPFTSAGNGVRVTGENVAFCNLTVIKLWDRYIQARRALLERVDKEKENIVVVYSVHTPFLLACADVKRTVPDLRIVLIVPDLPEFMAQKDTSVRRILTEINRRILTNLYRRVDAYVLLTDNMKERLPVGDRPCTVVEGMYDMYGEDSCVQTDVPQEKYILYTGTLSVRYGILDLVKAFMSLSAPDLRLYICGDGDAADEIVRLSRMDSRIVYKGLVKRERAMQLQRNAMLLVNPRTPEGEFTKYSFPSKVMEYLASGTPVLMYRLPGIPEEYYQYCYSLEECGVRPLAEALEAIIAVPEDIRVQKGRAARQFILTEKNPACQAKKIADLLSQVVRC